MAGQSKVDRHRRILEVLTEDRRALLPDLERVIEASRITIQRDLAELESRGLIERFHGGAMLAGYDVSPVSHARRMMVNRETKRRLAAVAAREIREGTFVALDASSTVYHVCETALPAGLTVVTSGLDTFVDLQRHNPGRRIQPILTGGRLQPETHTLVGPDALRTIASYRYEIFLFSAYSVIAGDGVYEYSEANAEVKRAFALRSDRRVLLLDRSKLEHRGGVRICGLDEVELVITDAKPAADLEVELEDRVVVIENESE